MNPKQPATGPKVCQFNVSVHGQWCKYPATHWCDGIRETKEFYCERHAYYVERWGRDMHKLNGGQP